MSYAKILGCETCEQYGECVCWTDMDQQDWKNDLELSPKDELLQEKMQRSIYPEQDGDTGKTIYIGKFLNVYLTDRAYGGPEEGGWWYDCGQFVRGQQVHDEELERVKNTLQAWCDDENSQRRSDTGSVLSEGRYEVFVEDEPGEDYPQQRPHYE